MYAVTEIRYREPGTDKNLVFAPGDEVKGLPKEVIKRLAEVGSISKSNSFPVEEVAPVVEESTESPQE